ncbi:MAG: DsbE family thiol:disulfide interchange protein [Alphaproteobacteria bacterium]|nr:DsbE family thiol:disulfide interchange protein [Alphaproteobacteria bacterium]
MNNRILLRFAPLLVLLAIIILGGLGLFGRYDPARAPSPMMDKQVNFFDLPMVMGDAVRFTPHNWRGRVVVLNLFATWCQPCIIEHPELMKLAATGQVEIHGIAWRDKRENVLEWLKIRGNPYRFVGLDESGKSSIALGVMGVPETYIIDKHGRIRYTYRSNLTADIIQNEIIPAVQLLKAEP